MGYLFEIIDISDHGMGVWQAAQPAASKGVKRVGSIVLSQKDLITIKANSGVNVNLPVPGKINVPNDIFKQYNEKGASREKLFEAFISTGGEKDWVQDLGFLTTHV
jgi:hypothetical protein